MKLFFYCISFQILFSFSILAQAVSDSLFSYSLDSVIVSASRYSIPLNDAPFSIIISDSQKINNVVNPLSLEELLNSGAGIFVFNRNNLSQGDKITIRGIGTRAQFGVRGIKIFLDGIPMTFPDGQAQLNNINVQDIESAEVLLGPSSVIYGNSLGGAIIMRSKRNKKKEFGLRPSFTVGSFGQKKYSLSTSYNSRISSINLAGYFNESTGFRDHSNAKFYGLNLLSDFQLTQSLDISLTGNYYSAPYLLNPSTLNKVESKRNPKSVRNSTLNFASAKKVEQFQSGVNINFSVSDDEKISTTFYLVSRDLDNSIPGRLIDLNKFLGGVRMEYEGKMKFFNTEIDYLTGIDYEFQRDIRSEFKSEGIADPLNISPENVFNEIKYGDLLVNQNERVNSLGIFSHVNLELTKKLKLFAGIRYDDFQFKFENKLESGNDCINLNNLSITGGLNLRLKESLNIYANYSTGFQTPTTNEFSNNPLSEGGFNRNLKPEFVKNYELGVKGWFQGPDIIYRLSSYYMDFSDLLISYQSEEEETFYRNAGMADNFGVEVSLEYYPSIRSKVSASYNYISYKFKDYSLIRDYGDGLMSYQLKGNHVPGVPENNLMTSFSYNFTDYLYSRIDINYTSEYFTNDFNGPLPNSKDEIDNYVNDSFIKVNFSSVYSHMFKEFEIILRFKVENLFDERFNQSVVPNAFGSNFFEPSPGRSFYFTITANY